jgi:hypothetical protein
MLKETKYRCWGYPFPGCPEFHKVVYAIIGNVCYFSGTERGTSTINAAESIIKEICTQENVPIKNLRFVDIQTHLGYRKPSGVYMVNELTIKLRPGTKRKGGIEQIEIGGEKGLLITGDQEGFEVTSWAKTPFPVDVLELFRPYIGEPNEKVECTVCDWEGIFSDGKIELSNTMSRCACPKCGFTLVHWPQGFVIQ